MTKLQHARTRRTSLHATVTAMSAGRLLVPPLLLLLATSTVAASSATGGDGNTPLAVWLQEVGFDAEQIEQLERFQKAGELGWFALTEKLAGVQSGLLVETTATFDRDNDCFVISSPTEGANKNVRAEPH